MKIKQTTTILTLTALLTSAVPAMPARAAASINIGDYLEMGTYYGEPILWRCVSFNKISGYDTNGNAVIDLSDTSAEYRDGYLPLMLTDRIICIKPFDASGDNTSGSHGRSYNNGEYRKQYGSNYWADSNIRSWLNSNESAGNVTWLCGNPPDEAHVLEGNNDYADEAGFKTNFTSEELGAVRRVTQSSLLNYNEYADMSHYGSTYNECNDDIANVVQNANTTAYRENVTDDFFLLDVNQVNAVYNNGSALGSDYYIGRLTAKSAEISEYKTVGLEKGNKWSYWLRSTYAGEFDYGSVRFVGSGFVGDCQASNDSHGIRPAFYLDLQSLTFTSGQGAYNSPYRIYGTGSNVFKVEPMIVGSEYHVAVLKSDGTVWSWGDNKWGQLGDGTNESSNTPVKSLIDEVVQIAAGTCEDYSYSNAVTYALKSDGSVWAWGRNQKGQLGNGNTVNQNKPVRVEIQDVIQIEAGHDFALALKKDGTVWYWGDTFYFDSMGLTATSVPKQITAVENVKQIKAGTYHIIYLKNDNTLWTQGWNYAGQLGDGTTNDRAYPIKVNGDDVKTICNISSCGMSAIIKNDNTLWACGSNDFNQIAESSNYYASHCGSYEPFFRKINNTEYKYCSYSGSYALAIDNNNTLETWGYNPFSQLSKPTFEKIQILKNVYTVVALTNLCAAIKENGDVYTWGKNNYGQLGNGCNENSNVPQLINLNVYNSGGAFPPTNGGEHAPTVEEWNYSPNMYDHDLAYKCARLSAAMYETYRSDDKRDLFYESKSTSDELIKSVMNEYGLTYNRAENVGKGENGIHYIISSKSVRYNGEERTLVVVACRGTSGKEWYGNMDITGKNYSYTENDHSSFRIAASALDKKISEYAAGKNDPMVVITGHSRGAAVANLAAYDMTSGKVNGVDRNSIYAYTFACPNTTRYPDTSMKNIHNFCFADDFVPAFPLDAWDYGKHGVTHITSADYLLSNDPSFKNDMQTVVKKSGGNKPTFAYLRTKALFDYVPLRWKDVNGYYNARPLTRIPATSFNVVFEPLTLYGFTHDYLAPTQIGGTSLTEGLKMVSTISSSIYTPITTYLLDGAAEGFMNNNHQMYTYYAAFKTGRFDSERYMPDFWESAILFEDAPAESYDEKQLETMRNFLLNDSNAELLGWNADDVSTWDTIKWDESGNIKSIAFYYQGLSGKLDLTDFVGLEQLICPGNMITELCLDGCDKLSIVDCSDNQLETLNVSLPMLSAVNCDNNYIDTESLSEFEKLEEDGVIINYKNQKIKQDAVYDEHDINELKKILVDPKIWDLSSNPSEWYGITWEKRDGIYRCTGINISDLNLKADIEITDMDALESFFCANNELGALSLHGCESLRFINCEGCGLNDLDIEASNIEYLNCENNILSSEALDRVNENHTDSEILSDNQFASEEAYYPLSNEKDKLTAYISNNNSIFKLRIEGEEKNSIGSEDIRVYIANYDDEDRLISFSEVSGLIKSENEYVYRESIGQNAYVYIWSGSDVVRPIFECIRF